MGRKRKYDIPVLAGELYDRLANRDISCEHGVRGMTMTEIAEELVVPAYIASRVVRTQRLIFGDSDEINIPYHVCGHQRYYHLSGSIDAGERWNAIRLRNELAQVQVSLAWWKSLSRAHPESGLVKLNLVAYSEIETRIRLLLGDAAATLLNEGEREVHG